MGMDGISAEWTTLAVSGIVLGKPLHADIALPESVLNRCVGTYFMTGSPKRIMIIQKENGHLVADVK